MNNRYSMAGTEASERRLRALEALDREARLAIRARRLDGHPPPSLPLAS